VKESKGNREREDNERLDCGTYHWLPVIEGREEDSSGGERKQKSQGEKAKRERRRLTRRGFGRKSDLRLRGALGRSGRAGEAIEGLDGGEGDRRRRRRGEVDWDKLPTLIIWENVGRGGLPSRRDVHHNFSNGRLDPHILILIPPKINKKFNILNSEEPSLRLMSFNAPGGESQRTCREPIPPVDNRLAHPDRQTLSSLLTTLICCD
jgi:hypothetical protein